VKKIERAAGTGTWESLEKVANIPKLQTYNPCAAIKKKKEEAELT